jgi:hypothetical protein
MSADDVQDLPDEEVPLENAEDAEPLGYSIPPAEEEEQEPS